MKKQMRSMNDDEGRGLSLASTADLSKRLWPLVLLALWAGPSYADPAPAPTTAAPAYPAMFSVERYLPASQAAEIASARSAAPASISDKAEILVLGAHGFEAVVQGSNGFVCYVGRSWEKDFDDPEFWNPTIRTPQCWNAAAVSSVLPGYLKRTQWVLAGVSKDEMLARTKAAVAIHEIGSPAPISMAYMLSKEQYINDVPPGQSAHWHPHVMFFVPTVVGEEGSAWGANGPGAQVISTTSDVWPVTTYFVVSPKWSDGTLAQYTTASAATTAKPETHHH